MLNFELGKIKNWETVTKTPNGASNALNPVTENLIWLCILVGMGGITEKNAKQFYRRVSFYERANGTSLKLCGEDGTTTDRPITWEDVDLHIGLTTNVTTMTDATFLKKVWGNYLT